MVGFKNLSLGTILIASMAIVGCIPQAKQTSCAENEAFSPTQRKCLPVNPSEASFIKISSTVPTGGITQTASSGSQTHFTIMVENPYSKNYRVQWLRNFNGVQSILYTPSQPSSQISEHPYSITLIPNSDLMGAVGNHIITAQILDAHSNRILDSHDFMLELINDPIPNGQGFNPGLSAPIITTPINTNMTFSFSVLRNNRSMDTPRVQWKVTKLTGTPPPGGAVLQENDILLNVNAPQPVNFIFNPADPYRTMGGAVPTTPQLIEFTGKYRLEASIMDGGTTYSTYYWDIEIRNPELGTILNATSPAAGGATTVKAFNDIPYSNNSTDSNFSYHGDTRARFCVQVSDADGRYGNGVRVRYYLANSTDEVWSTTTTDVGRDTICLDDALNPIKENVVFRNSNLNASWNTNIVARVFDVDTNEEYKSYPAGSYPITWSIRVQPQNTAPVLSFADVPGSVVCGSTAIETRNDCDIIQSNTNTTNTLRIAFNITDDHFTESEKFRYTAHLTRGATIVETCTKDFGVIAPAPFICDFKVPAYDDNGSIDPAAEQWRVTLNVTDEGSPFTPGSNQKSASLLWNLKVKEINEPPVLVTPNPILAYNPLNPSVAKTVFEEKETINFSVRLLVEPERDPYILQLDRCTGGVSDHHCNNLITAPPVPYVGGPYNYLENRSLSLPLHDGFLPANVETDNVTFRIKVIDIASRPDTVPYSNEVVETITLTINNNNPAPTFANIDAIDINPANGSDPGIDYIAFSSFPLTLDPGTITDASDLDLEGNIQKQWWIAPYPTNPLDSPNWSELDGATSRLLSWTPASNIISGNYLIKLCITDGYPTRNTLDPDVAGAICNNPAIVSVYSNQLEMPFIDSSGGQYITGAPAIWIDTTLTGKVLDTPDSNSNIVYTAYIVHDLSGTGSYKINVQKSIYNHNGTGEMRKIAELSFDAIDPVEQAQPSFNITGVKDLRIVGDKDNLYVAYLAHTKSDTLLEGYKPEIRRIYKGDERGAKADIHPSPFGFSYHGFYVNHSGQTNPCTNCWNTALTPPVTAIEGGSITLDATNIDIGSTIELGYASGDYTVSFQVPSIASPTPELVAQSIAHQINTSLDFGFSALSNGGGIVTIYGPMAKDAARIQKTTDHLGKIWIDPDTLSDTLYVPYINLSAASPNTRSIAIEAYQNDPSQSLWSISQGPGVATYPLHNTQGTSSFDNALDANNNILFSYVNQSGNTRLLKLAPNDFFDVSNHVAILSGKNIEKIKLAGSNNKNNFYYVMAQTSDKELYLARIPSNLSTPHVWPFTATEDGITSSLLSSIEGHIHDFAIEAANTDQYATSAIAEARILISASNAVYAFRALSANLVTCGSCAPISHFDSQVSPDAPLLGVSQLLENQALSSPGNFSSSNNEHIRDIWGFTYIGSTSPTMSSLYMGIINTERIKIDSNGPPSSSGFSAPAIFKY